MARSKRIADMSSYFLLSIDADRDDLEAVADSELGNLSVTTFWTGEPYQGSDLGSAILILTDGNPAACLGNPLSWLIISPDCAKHLSPLFLNDVQLLPLRARLIDGSIDAERYVLVNPLRVVDAIHSPNKPKRYIDLTELVLDAKQIPADCHIFRLKYNETAIVVSAEVVQRLHDHKLEGLMGIPLECINREKS